MYPQPPPGQGPIDPRGAFTPPTPPGAPQMQQPPNPYAPGAFPPPPNMMPPMPPVMPPNMMPPNMMPPPPNFMMPPPMYMPPAPQRRGGFARAIFTVLATTILGLSLTL